MPSCSTNSRGVTYHRPRGGLSVLEDDPGLGKGLKVKHEKTFEALLVAPKWRHGLGVSRAFHAMTSLHRSQNWWRHQPDVSRDGLLWTFLNIINYKKCVLLLFVNLIDAEFTWNLSASGEQIRFLKLINVSQLVAASACHSFVASPPVISEQTSGWNSRMKLSENWLTFRFLQRIK